MLNDPIVEEVRRIRQEYAKKFNYDLDAIYRDIKKQEQRSGRKLVDLAAKKRRGPKKKSSRRVPS